MNTGNDSEAVARGRTDVGSDRRTGSDAGSSTAGGGHGSPKGGHRVLSDGYDSLSADVGPMDGLFELDPSQRKPLAKVVIVAGPSGSGKTRFTPRSGLPVVSMDEFYFDGDRPGMPRRHGMIDWDSPKTWDRAGAVGALVELCTTGRTEVPIYDIPTNRRTGTRTEELDGAKYVLAEGIFAPEIVDDLRREGILADAICLQRPRVQTFWFRLVRDLDEGRKPPINLIRRGIAHFRAEPKTYRRLQAKGLRLVTWEEAHETLTNLLARAR